MTASLQQHESSLFLNIFDQNFTIILVGPEGPSFIRTKALSSTVTDAELYSRVMAEVETSISAVSADDHAAEAVTRLFIFSERLLSDVDREVKATFHLETTWLQRNGHAHLMTGIRDDGSADGTMAHGTAHQGDEQTAVDTAFAAVVGRHHREMDGRCSLPLIWLQKISGRSSESDYS